MHNDGPYLLQDSRVKPERTPSREVFLAALTLSDSFDIRSKVCGVHNPSKQIVRSMVHGFILIFGRPSSPRVAVEILQRLTTVSVIC